MGSTRRVRFVASWLALLGALVVASPASAQFYDDARRALGFSPDPLARSPRLIGMGGLSLVVDDIHNRIDLWEFAGNAAGLLDADSISTLEIHPGTRSTASAHDLPGAGSRERQDFALREAGVGYEAWRRSSNTTIFGVSGEFGSLRTDTPMSSDLERRSTIDVPRTTGLVSGRLPFLAPDRLRYGVRIQHRYESVGQDYLTYVENAAGEFIDKDGTTVGPPDFFTPDRRSVRSIGIGGALSFRFGAPLIVAAGYDHVANGIESRNDGFRYSGEIREDRPYGIGQAVVTGSIGGRLAYIADGRSWSSNSNERWAFTLSAGTGGRPILGRGHYLYRDEKGRSLRSRASMTAGRFVLGAGLDTYYREASEAAPSVDDLTSFNHFRNFLFNKAGVDSLVLPDSLVTNAAIERSWNAGVGVATKLPFRDGTLGLEVHKDEVEFEQTIAGVGPRPAGWDARCGMDLELNRVMRLLAGYVYRRADQDRETSQNEYVAHTVTLGFTLRPAAAHWALDSGYAVSWSRSDFGDPARSRSDGQRLLTRLRWEL